MKKIGLPFLFLLCCGWSAFSQPAPYLHKITFMVSYAPSGWVPATFGELKERGVRFFVPVWGGDPEVKLEYDEQTKSFTVTTYGLNLQEFYIVHKNDTTRVAYPAVKWIDFNLIHPIPLDGKNYNFYSPVLYNAIQSNVSRQSPECRMSTFYFCSGCILSEYVDGTAIEIPKNLVEVK